MTGASKDPWYAEKKARVEYLYAIADREITPADGDPEVVFCVDEFVLVNRIEAQFTALRYFALDGTDHASHKERPA